LDIGSYAQKDCAEIGGYLMMSREISVTSNIGLRKAEERALSDWREALQGADQLDRAEKFLLYLDARHAAAPLAAFGRAGASW
jgi:hypothetical protein